jgi:hypothetical protein
MKVGHRKPPIFFMKKGEPPIENQAINKTDRSGDGAGREGLFDAHETR